MKRILTMTWLCFLFSGLVLYTQAQVSGTVKDGDGEVLIGVSVTVKGTFVGTTTDVNGNFSIKPDFSKGNNTIVFSYVGYKSQELEVSQGQTGISVTLAEATFMADEVIVSASRVEERIMETPVTVEAVSAKQLQTQGSSELLSSLARFKGIDVNQSSLLISSLSTRGFNSAKSERVIQMTDLADNMSPSLSLYAGNINGAPEIDIESVDIIHGANSSLYGANAFNGVILTTTKDPFMYEGLTVDLRGGTRDLLDGSIRIAAKITDRFAFKLTASYFTANDFVGTNLTARSRRIEPANNTQGDPRGYDGLNLYGDISFANQNTVINANGTRLSDLGFQGNAFLPGFTEQELVGDNYKAFSFRLNPSVHYLITDKIKASYEYRLGQGSGLYQSSNRYAWEKLEFDMHKFEIKSDNWFVRAYRQGDAPGNTYDLSFLGTGMVAEQPYQPLPGQTNNFPGRTYAQAYGATYIGNFAAARQGGASVQDSYLAAQQAAAGIIPTGSDPRFAALREAGLNSTGGFNPSFNNRSNFWDFSTQYKIPTDFANIIIGGSYRRFNLTSSGTLFADGDGSPIGGEVRDQINNYEWGMYAQVQKALFNEKLKLSVAGRVDNFQNFDSKFSPRVSAVYTVDADRKHNFRASYAQAFRAPAQVDQYIYLDIGPILLLSNIGENATGGFNGIRTDNLQAQFINPLRLEQMNTWEIGYKGILFEGFYIDLSYYRSNYTDFIGTQRFFGREDGTTPDLTQVPVLGGTEPAPTDPGYRNRTRVMQVWLNAEQEVISEGFQLGFEYYAQKIFNITFNYTWSVINDVPGLILGFNTPEHKVNLGFNGEPFKNFNYNLNIRYTDTYEYFMPFDEGVIQNFAAIDAQITYKASKLNTTFRLGGTNLTDSNAIQVYGAAPIGRILYLGATFDANVFKKK